MTPGSQQLRKLTQVKPTIRVSELAEALEVSRATVYAWINQTSVPSVQQARWLERAYGIQVGAWEPVKKRD